VRTYIHRFSQENCQENSNTRTRAYTYKYTIAQWICIITLYDAAVAVMTLLYDRRENRRRTGHTIYSNLI